FLGFILTLRNEPKPVLIPYTGSFDVASFLSRYFRALLMRFSAPSERATRPLSASMLLMVPISIFSFMVNSFIILLLVFLGVLCVEFSLRTWRLWFYRKENNKDIREERKAK